MAKGRAGYKVRTFTCDGCGVEVTKRCPPGSRYCSLDCYRSSPRPERCTGEGRTCGRCGSAFYVPASRVAKGEGLYCSLDCHNAAQGDGKTEHTCKTCGGAFRWSPSRSASGAYRITYCSLPCRDADDLATSQAKNPGRSDTVTSGVYGAGRPQQSVNTSGRWPANVVLDEAQAEALDEQSGESVSRFRDDLRSATPRVAMAGGMLGGGMPFGGHEDSGGASRFFYVAKADASERPRLPKRSLRLRDDLTPEQVDHVRARLVEAGVQVD